MKLTKFTLTSKRHGDSTGIWDIAPNMWNVFLGVKFGHKFERAKKYTFSKTQLPKGLAEGVGREIN